MDMAKLDFDTFNSLVLKFLPNKKVFGSVPPESHAWYLWNGYCAEWAYIFAKIYGGDIAIVRALGDYFHVMVVKDELYYDAGHFEGVSEDEVLAYAYGSSIQRYSTSQYENKILAKDPKLFKYLLNVCKMICKEISESFTPTFTPFQ